eukprot:scpid97530/ scgid26991/ 
MAEPTVKRRELSELEKRRFPAHGRYTWEDVWLSNQYVQKRYHRTDQVQWRYASMWYVDWVYWLFMSPRTFIKAMSIPATDHVDIIAKNLLLQHVLDTAVAFYTGPGICQRTMSLSM